MRTVRRARLDIPARIRDLPSAKPAFIPPMKARLVETLPSGPEWLYEIKFDGVRALAIKNGKTVSLLSRTAKDFGSKYPQVLAGINDVPGQMTVLDGEIVALDSSGRPNFQLLQAYYSTGGAKPPLSYYVFDALNLEGRDLTGLPLEERKRLAQTLVTDLEPVFRFSSSIEAQSARVQREMQTRGLEGLIAKRKGSQYEPGRRSGAWVKFKWTRRQEFVIGGYTPPQGARAHFGALLVGYYHSNRLLFAGKVGTGFNERLLASLFQRMQKLRRAQCPFANLPESFPGGLTASQMRSCIWVEPKLVGEVRFSEWTRDNHLRQPAFVGLREDKDPKEVVKEEAP
jgi:bifunctional non-homologous end joining protein LigD